MPQLLRVNFFVGANALSTAIYILFPQVSFLCLMYFLFLQSSAAVADTLDCYRARKFWISWTNGLIQAGSGKLGQNVIISWQDPNPPTLTVLLLLSTYEMAPAEWTLPKSLGNDKPTIHLNIFTWYFIPYILAQHLPNISYKISYMPLYATLNWENRTH